MPRRSRARSSTSSTSSTLSRRRRTSTSSSRRRRNRQTGGFRTVLPMKYFTNHNNHNVYNGKPGVTNFRTAYEESRNTSPGVFNAANAASGTTCANLAPGCGFSDTCRTSGIQTGGRRGRRHRRRGPQRSRRSRTSRRSASKSRKSIRRQRGGGGSYGRTVLPAKYYGGETDVFTAPPGCQTFETAYGMSNPSMYSMI